MRSKRRLTIVRVGNAGIAPEVVGHLARRLAGGLNLSVEVETGAFLADAESHERADHPGHPSGAPGESDATDLPRISSNAIVDALAARFGGEDDEWVLAITAHDLSAPGRSFVFGEAALGGWWAVVSMARFGASDAASPRLLERLYKEAVHELGHLAGLDHCAGSGRCVMEVSTTVSAIDAKNSEFCPHCDAEFLRKQVEG